MVNKVVVYYVSGNEVTYLAEQARDFWDEYDSAKRCKRKFITVNKRESQVEINVNNIETVEVFRD